MAKAKSRSSELKNAQILSIHGLGLYCYLTNTHDDKVSANVYLNSKPNGNRYTFIDNTGIAFYVENGDYIKELVIKSLVLGDVQVGAIDIDVTADTTGLMTIKNIYIEV